MPPPAPSPAPSPVPSPAPPPGSSGARPNDRGRAQVYRCEDLYSRMCARANPPSGPVLTEIAGSAVVLPAERKFGSVEDVSRYVTAVSRAAPEVLWPQTVPHIVVRRRRGPRSAHWEAPATIALPDTADMLREHVVLHELAHHLDHHNPRRPGPAHGPGFREMLTGLHSVATGPVGGWALGVLFDLHLDHPTTHTRGEP